MWRHVNCVEHSVGADFLRESEGLWLAHGLTRIDGLDVDLRTVQTNNVTLNTKRLGVEVAEFPAKLHGQDSVQAAMSVYREIRHPQGRGKNISNTLWKR